MEKHYEIARIPICIRADDAIMYNDDRILSPFVSAPSPGAVVYSFKMTDILPRAAGIVLSHTPELAVFRSGDTVLRYYGAASGPPENGYMCAEYGPQGVNVSLKESENKYVSVRSVLNALAMEHLCVKHGGVILHSVYTLFRGRAILFTAPSGTGKSTQAGLWQKYMGAETVNGDRTIIVPAPSGVAAFSLPYAGSSGICKNISAPVAAIVYLQQSAENSLHRLTGYQAFRRIWEGCFINTWDRSDVDAASNIVGQAAGGVPVFMLRCTPDKSAVLLLASALENL